MKTITAKSSKSERREVNKMKKTMSIIAILVVTVLFAVTGFAVAGEMTDQKLITQKVDAGDQFSALNDIPAEEMKDSQMNQIVGKGLSLSIVSFNPQPEPPPGSYSSYSIYRSYSLYKSYSLSR